MAQIFMRESRREDEINATAAGRMSTLSGQAIQDQFQPPEAMKSFDLFLVPPSKSGLSTEAIGEQLASCPWLTQDRSDPTQLAYRNEDTSVTFFLLLDPDLAEHTFGGEGEDPDAPGGSTSVLPEGEDIDEAGLPGTDEDELEAVMDVPPVTINIPLFQPLAVAREAIDLLLQLAEAGGLDTIDPQEEGAGNGEPGRYSKEDLLESWLRTQDSICRQAGTPVNFIRWSQERSLNFFGYSQACPQLRKQYEAEGLAVLQVQPAAYNEEVLSLCVWRSNVPAVIPLTDLVLLERVRRKRRLFGTREVVDEILIPGGELWKILSPFSQVCNEPARMLVFRDAAMPPSQVAYDLAELTGEKSTFAKRTEFSGVIDFDLPGPAQEREDSLEQ